ncbi:hypothetical protein GCM10010358_24440 [Streptomyces minutiscleroticus]|uniref:Fe2OG dioxygenase domain-containing protein n=1 Tax=Streptomyces minutiscleroticus TaxID=68238 RepID=A0A918NI36_9ACTN|nr:2OG-Fe(II) oxygenase [Streptomyces minutiscleroticus]GGX69149.1 hypothetical protein GCM10010358_24440 [Streptomyces minutiscleroticus]
MGQAARERLARVLGAVKPAGAFSAQLSAPAHLLELEVHGVGAIRLPLRAPQAKQLIQVARPARFGRGEQTLSDPAVRDTWELTPEQFAMRGTGWEGLLDGALDHFREELGLPPGTRLRAEPHSFLVYGKGQFFLPHQDSEKDDSMVGTLVVSLPSPHTGGELIVEHAGERVTYRASKQDLTLVAFYADCRHQVTPVRSGHRHTLTFNLLAETTAQEAGQDAARGPVTEAARHLTEHFTRPAASRYGDGLLDPPNRLVFLLDHEYTQRGLSWSRLKGADATYAATLRAAARQAGCEAVLALAEVKETWDAYPADEDPWGDDHDYYDEEESEAEDAEETSGDLGDYQLNELVDDEITLSWWTTPDATAGEPVTLPVSWHETCSATPNSRLTPHHWEYEGYMGNYGNTLDRWYHRAAIVLWPRERAFPARAEADPSAALTEVRTRAENGDVQGARALAASLAPFWPTVTHDTDLFTAALDTAAVLDAPDTATMLLSPFGVAQLSAAHGTPMAAAARRYGERWTKGIVTTWFAAEHHNFDRIGWTQGTLRPLCETLHTAQSPGTARLLAAGIWKAVADELHRWTAAGAARREFRRPALEALAAPLADLVAVADEALHQTITGSLRSYPDTVLECLLPALRSAQASGTTAGWDAIAQDCARRLSHIAAQPPRDPADWSLPAAGAGCGCDLCDLLDEFLISRTRRSLEWPLAQAGRRHIHFRIDAADLPVNHETRRQGRPYTLVLTKTEELFTRAAQARRQVSTDLAWLTKAYGLA